MKRQADGWIEEYLSTSKEMDRQGHIHTQQYLWAINLHSGLWLLSDLEGTACLVVFKRSQEKTYHFGGPPKEDIPISSSTIFLPRAASSFISAQARNRTTPATGNLFKWYNKTSRGSKGECDGLHVPRELQAGQCRALFNRFNSAICLSPLEKI